MQEAMRPKEPGDLFAPEDDDKFRESVTKLLGKDAPALRGISSGAYVDRCRAIWKDASSQFDEVFTVRFLVDTLTERRGDKSRRFEREPWPEFSHSGAENDDGWGGLYCSVFGFADLSTGRYFGAPDGYVLPPENPRVRRLIVPYMPDPEHDATGANPEAPADYAIALLDVLGFKRLLATRGLTETKKAYDLLVQVALRGHSEGAWAPTIVPFGPSEACAGLQWLPISHANFSDSLLLWVPLRTRYVSPFIDRCIEVFCEALSLGIPLRGAVTFGGAVLSPASRTFLGQPLVDLFAAEEAQDWTGMVVLPPGEDHAQSALIEPDRVMPYAVPRKVQRESRLNGFVSNVLARLCSRFRPLEPRVGGPELAVDWPRRWRAFTGTSPVERLRELRAVGFEKYYDNAITFARISDCNADWWTQIAERKTKERNINR